MTLRKLSSPSSPSLARSSGTLAEVVSAGSRIWCCSARQYARHCRSHWSSRISQQANSAVAAPLSTERRRGALDDGDIFLGCPTRLSVHGALAAVRLLARRVGSIDTNGLDLIPPVVDPVVPF